MIATVQNTSKTVMVNGKKATVWEGLSQGGIRFHLFVFAARPMDKNEGETKLAKYRQEMAETKLAPAVDTNLLPTEIGDAI
jgi:hypothetical protein